MSDGLRSRAPRRQKPAEDAVATRRDPSNTGRSDADASDERETAPVTNGVVATHPSTTVLFFAGLSRLVAGALSMGGGEFTSVRAQRDSQDALLRTHRHELATIPHEELDELAHLYVERGLSLRLAREVAAELGIDLADQVNPGRPQPPQQPPT